jgi:hypothetical protein
MRLFIRRFLGEDVSSLGFDALADKLEEASIMKEFEIGIIREAIVQAFGGNK